MDHQHSVKKSTVWIIASIVEIYNSRASDVPFHNQIRSISTQFHALIRSPDGSCSSQIQKFSQGTVLFLHADLRIVNASIICIIQESISIQIWCMNVYDMEQRWLRTLKFTLQQMEILIASLKQAVSRGQQVKISSQTSLTKDSILETAAGTGSSIGKRCIASRKARFSIITQSNSCGAEMERKDPNWKTGSGNLYLPHHTSPSIFYPAAHFMKKTIPNAGYIQTIDSRKLILYCMTSGFDYGKERNKNFL